MASKYWAKVSQAVAPASKLFAKKSLDVVDQIHHILEQKNMTQKDLAQKLGKSESEISKWLSGGHNITLKTIAKLEIALDATILTTPLRQDGHYYSYQSYQKVAKIIPISTDNWEDQIYTKGDYKIQNDSQWHSKKVSLM